MSNILTQLLIFILLFVFKIFVDWGIKRSERTENTIDDLIFAILDMIINVFTKNRKK